SATFRAVSCLILTTVMLVRLFNGGFFYGIVVTTIIGMIVGLISVPATIVGKIPSLEPTFGVVFNHLHEIFTPELITVIFTFFFVAFFDTAGALIGLTC